MDRHIEQLQQSDPDLKREAIRRILIAPSPEGERALVGFLADPSHGVREAAAEALRVVGGPAALESLIPLLYSDSPFIRNTAIEILIGMGSKAVPRVSALRGDPDPDIRKFSADILGAVGGRESLSALLGLLDDSNDNVRHAAAEALGRLGLPEAIPRLSALLAVPGSHWYPVVTALGQIGDPSVVPVLLSALAEADPVTTVSILEIIGRLGDRAAYDQVVCQIERAKCPRAQEPAPLQIAACFRALLQLSGRLSLPLPPLVPAFVLPNVDALLAEGDREGVLASISAYGAMIPPAWAPRILALADGEGSADLLATAVALCRRLPAVIVSALERCPAEPREAFLDGLIEDPTPQIVEALVAGLSLRQIGEQAELVEALGRIGDPRAVDAMLTLLREGDAWLKARTAEALGRIGALEAAPILLELIAEGGEEAALKAYCRALHAIDPSAMSRTLPDLLAHGDPAVRRAALDTLGGDLEDPALLFPLTQDPDPLVRCAAVRLLPASSPASLEPLLLALLDEDGGVRRAAVRALAALGTDEALAPLESLYKEEADPLVRCEVTVVLRDQVGAPAKPLLLAALNDPTPLVRMAAARAFGVSGDPKESTARFQLRELGDPELTAALSADPVAP